jgi:hypothetical protein
VATWKSYFSGIKKISFSWRPEKAIFGKPKKSPFRGDLKKRFFWDRRNRLFVAT